MNSMTIITDHRGKFLTADYDYEPEPSSVVLTEGVHGTAWQRFFSDGLWHSPRGGATKTWAELLTYRNLILIYDAEIRVAERTGRRVG